MAYKNRFHKTTPGIDAQVFVGKAVAYTSQADLKSFQASAVEGEIGIYKAADNTLVSGAVAANTDVFIALKRDGNVETSTVFKANTANTLIEKVTYAAPVKHQITITSNGIAASLVVNDLTYTALIAGTAGNSITITHVVAGANTPLSVSVTGTAITVNLATSAGSAATSTATQVAAAIAASAAASALVTVAITGTAATVQAAKSVTNLAGGTAEYAAVKGDYLELVVVETTPLMQPLPTVSYGITAKANETYSSMIQRLAALINNAQSFENQNRQQIVTATVTGANDIVLTSINFGEHFTVGLRGVLLDNATAAVTAQFNFGTGTPEQVLIFEKAGDIRKGVTTNYPDQNATPEEFGKATSFVDTTLTYRSFKFRFYAEDRTRTLDREQRLNYILVFVPQGGTTPDTTLATIFAV
jgi:hypothetical protein